MATRWKCECKISKNGSGAVTLHETVPADSESEAIAKFRKNVERREASKLKNGYQIELIFAKPA